MHSHPKPSPWEANFEKTKLGRLLIYSPLVMCGPCFSLIHLSWTSKWTLSQRKYLIVSKLKIEFVRLPLGRQRRKSSHVKKHQIPQIQSCSVLIESGKTCRSQNRSRHSAREWKNFHSESRVRLKCTAEISRTKLLLRCSPRQHLRIYLNLCDDEWKLKFALLHE